VAGRLVLPEQDYPGEERRRHFADAIRERLEAMPGVERAAVATAVPIGGPRQTFKLPGRQYANDSDYHSAHVLSASPGYFETLRVRVRGRAFDDRDVPDGMPTAIVNASFERRYFPKGALGEQVALASGTHQEWRTVVGVVPDLGMGRAPGDRLVDAVYLPLAQLPASTVTLIVHAGGDPLQVVTPMRDAVRAIDPNLPLFDTKTVKQTFEDNTWLFRVLGSLFITFGFASLFLAAVGLYAVMAFSVSRRTQEIGVRMAVGASGSHVLGLILRQGLLQVVIGIVLGVGLAALIASGLQILLFGVKPYDPIIFGMIALALSLTGLVACALPALRAARVDPMTALRYQ
jgi:putative ABC transport system permease protein